MSSKKKKRKKRKAAPPRQHAEKLDAPQPPGRKDSTVGSGPRRPLPIPTQAIPGGPAMEIESLLAKGKIKAALSQAKIYHKKTGTSGSETILVTVYIARIREMLAKGYPVEARTLLELVEERYRCPEGSLAELSAVMLLREDRIDDLVVPLGNPDCPQAERLTIEKIIKNELIDLTELAQCEALPPDHSLKTAARAAAQAFARVTSDSVSDEDISLAEISRRSPLAPWKVLIRALAHFYRREDDLCEKYLTTVDPESAPARLVPIIRGLMAGQSKAGRDNRFTLLAEKVHGNNKAVRDAFQALDSALAANKRRKLFGAFRQAVDVCARFSPGLLEKLKQHISVKCWMFDIDAEDVARAMGGASLKNAYFWLLHARAAEEKGLFLWSCALLAEFRKHALHEGWFSERSTETSVIYLYMTDLLKRLPAEDFDWLQSEFGKKFDGFEIHYRHQPQSILEAASNTAGGRFEKYFIYPELLYGMAGEINPTAATFRQWLEWTESRNSNWKKCDAVALAWHTALPEDARPLLYLMTSAEKRNAFKKAIGYLDTAERIDRLNPDVKRARLRLLAATALRHLKQRKTHLAQKDILEIERWPQSREGDRPAFMAALKSACALIEKNESELILQIRELTDLLDHPLAARMILTALSRSCDLSYRRKNLPASAADSLEGHDLAASVARACRLGEDLAVAVEIPNAFRKRMKAVFAAAGSLPDTADIRIIAETALRNFDLQLAYAAAGAGLLQPGAAKARFLLLRARSLPPWEMERQDNCLAAVIELARRERDLDLIDEAVELLRSETGFQFGFSIFDSRIGDAGSSMETEELNTIIKRENDAREYPAFTPDKLYGDCEIDDDENECRYCDVKNCPDRETPYRPENRSAHGPATGTDPTPDFSEFIDEHLSRFPSALVALIQKVFAKHGENGCFPDAEEVARKDPWLADQLRRELLIAAADGTLPEFNRDCLPGWLSRSYKRRRR